MIQIVSISPSSQHFATVQKLGRANSEVLGFFPKGAFLEYALRQNILGAVNVDGECVGYLLYRVTNQRIIIVHLCVDQSSRGHGIAKLLVDTLSTTKSEYLGIGLRCRRDFAADKMWPRLGFVAQCDAPGRSSKGSHLTYWWRDHNHPNLFTTSDISDKTSIVIDANVFYDIVDKTDDQAGEESQSLTADWLQNSIDLCLTPEIHNEINRNTDDKRRDALHRLTSSFKVLPQDQNLFDQIWTTLIETFGPPSSSSNDSDIRHLAWTVAHGYQFFVTRDEAILNRADVLYDNYALTVIRPSDAIAHFDSIQREALYRPVQLTATEHTVRPILSREQADLAKVFRNQELGEAQSALQRSIRFFVSHVNEYKSLVINSEENGPLALLVYKDDSGSVLNIPLFRIRKLANKPSLAPTLVRHLILKMQTISAQSGKLVTHISDLLAHQIVTDALAQDEFLHSAKKGWSKPNPHFVGTSEQFMRFLSTNKLDNAGETEIPSKTSVEPFDLLVAAKLEDHFWPAKITDTLLPTFIVPIRPRWAEELFDDKLASQNLFGANSQLILNRESVYYRSKSPGGISAPGRILWYVSQDARYDGSKSLRACSVIEEVIIGKPKTLYKRFRRLGVFEWSDVLEVANGNIENEIMAVRFSRTESFRKEIAWRDLMKILEDHNCKSMLISPHRIQRSAFEHLYKLGMQMEFDSVESSL